MMKLIGRRLSVCSPIVMVCPTQKHVIFYSSVKSVSLAGVRESLDKLFRTTLNQEKTSQTRWESIPDAFADSIQVP